MSDLKKILEENPELTLKALQKFQGVYDNKFVGPKGFTGIAKIKHTYPHMGKLLGRLADYVHDLEETPESASDHEIRTKVIPDLLVYFAWIANVLGVNGEEAYLNRIIGNLNDKYKDKIPEDELKALEEEVGKRFGG